MRSSIQTTFCAYAKVKEADAGHRHALREHLRTPLGRGVGGLAIAANHKLQECVFQGIWVGGGRGTQTPRARAATSIAAPNRSNRAAACTCSSTSDPVRTRPLDPLDAGGWGAGAPGTAGGATAPLGLDTPVTGWKGSFACARAAVAVQRLSRTAIAAIRFAMRPRYAAELGSGKGGHGAIERAGIVGSYAVLSLPKTLLSFTRRSLFKSGRRAHREPADRDDRNGGRKREETTQMASSRPAVSSDLAGLPQKLYSAIAFGSPLLTSAEYPNNLARRFEAFKGIGRNRSQTNRFVVELDRPRTARRHRRVRAACPKRD